MTFILITNIVLAAAVFSVVVGTIAWTIRASAAQHRVGSGRVATARVRAPRTSTVRREARGSLVRQS